MSELKECNIRKLAKPLDKYSHPELLEFPDGERPFEGMVFNCKKDFLEAKKKAKAEKGSKWLKHSSKTKKEIRKEMSIDLKG